MNRIVETKLPDAGVVLDDLEAGTIVIEAVVGKIKAPGVAGTTPAAGVFEGASSPATDSDGSVTARGLTKVKIGAAASFSAGDYRFTYDASNEAVEMAAGKYQVGVLFGVTAAPVPGTLHDCIVEPLHIAEPA